MSSTRKRRALTEKSDDRNERNRGPRTRASTRKMNAISVANDGSGGSGGDGGVEQKKKTRRERLEEFRQSKAKKPDAPPPAAVSSSSSSRVKKKKTTTTGMKKKNKFKVKSKTAKLNVPRLVPPVATSSSEQDATPVSNDERLAKITVRTKRKSPEKLSDTQAPEDAELSFVEKMVDIEVADDDDVSDEGSPTKRAKVDASSKASNVEGGNENDERLASLMCSEELPVDFIEGVISRQLKELLNDSACTTQQRIAIINHVQQLEDKCWGLSSKLKDNEIYVNELRRVLLECREVNVLYADELTKLEAAHKMFYDRDNHYREVSMLYQCAKVSIDALEARCNDQAELLENLREQVDQQELHISMNRPPSLSSFRTDEQQHIDLNATNDPELQAKLDATLSEIQVKQTSLDVMSQDRAALRFEVDLQAQEMRQKERELVNVKSQFANEKQVWQQMKSETLDKISGELNTQMMAAMEKLKEFKNRLREEEHKNRQLREVLATYDAQHELVTSTTTKPDE